MKRRGFLGFIGGAAVAGPSMAQQAVASGLEALSLQGVMTGAAGMGIEAANAAYGGTYATEAEYNPLDEARRELSRLLGKSAAKIAKERSDIHVHALDPDIAVMRSLSLSTKVRMQQARMHQRDMERERGWIEDRIHRLLNPTQFDNDDYL